MQRLPYNDCGIGLYRDAGADPCLRTTIKTLRHEPSVRRCGECVHINLGKADEEYARVFATDPDNQTFTAVFTKAHALGATVRPTI
jgi:hypothetical protein